MGIRNSKRVLFLLVTTAIFILGNTGVTEAKTVKEHPMIRPFPGSVMAKNMCQYQKFNAFEFYYMNEKTKKREKKKVKGEYYKLLYEVRNASGGRVQDISRLEFYENYKNSAIEKGGKILYEGGVLTFTIPRDDGGKTWCQVEVSAGLGQQYLRIVDEKGMKQSMTFGPKALKDALDKNGKVLLYGILFDLDEAFLKPKSVKQLMHIVTLLQTYPDLYIEVQGHTDNQGGDEYNMKLSSRRAKTVCTYLQLFGIENAHLVPRGYGETKPVASNNTKEGRAKNRRVELVKITPEQARVSQKQAAKTAANASTELSASIEGKWQMKPNKRVKSGTIIFRGNNTYDINENLQDGDSIGRKGEYKIDTQTSPARIIICLGKCGIPGSEYTTSFGIYRFLPGEKLEILSSPDGKYPDQFSGNPADEYTMILTRLN